MLLFPTGKLLHIFVERFKSKDQKAKHMPAVVTNVTSKFSDTRIHKSLITQRSLSHVGMRKRFTAHHHFTFLKHVLWIILSSHLSLFVSIIQTPTTKSKSLRMWPKRNGTLIKLHFVQGLWWFPVFTTANRFERAWLRANSEKNEYFICTHISAEVKCYSRDIPRRVKQYNGCPVSYVLTELCCLRYSAAFSSALPPISPIRMMPSVLGSCRNTSRQSIKLVPLNGSPPIPCRRQSKQ